MLSQDNGAAHKLAPQRRKPNRRKAVKGKTRLSRGQSTRRMAKRISSRTYAVTTPRGTGSSSIARLAARLRESIRRLENATTLISEREKALEQALRRIETLLAQAPQSAPEIARAPAAKRKLLLSPRLLQVYNIVKQRKVITPNELSELMNLRPNTCSEYLKELVYRGHLQRVAHGMYTVAGYSEWTAELDSAGFSRGKRTESPRRG